MIFPDIWSIVYHTGQNYAMYIVPATLTARGGADRMAETPKYPGKEGAFMKNKLKRLLDAFDPRRFVKFGLIGVLNTLVDLIVFYFVYRLFCAGAGLDPDGLQNPSWVAAAAQAVSFVVAALNSFVWNKLWTFEKRGKPTGREIFRYLVTNLGYYLLSLGLIGLISRIFLLPATTAKLPATCIMLLYNYLMNKFWVFK